MEIFLLILIAVVFLVVHGVRKGKKTSDAWESAAKAMDLNFRTSAGGWRTLSGFINRLQISVKMAPSSQGNSKAPTLRYSAVVPTSLPFKLRITPEKFYSKVTNRLNNISDLELGDREFDAKFVVEGEDPDAIRELLELKNRNILRNLLARFDDLKLTETGLVVSRHTTQIDEATLIRDVTRLVKDTQELFASAPQKEPKIPTPPPLPERKKKEEPVVPEEPVVTTSKDDSAIHESDDDHAAEIEEIAPAPLSKSQLNLPEETAEPELEPAPEVASADEEPAEDDEPTLLSAFSEVSSRYEFVQTFEKEWADAYLFSTLPLLSVERYSMDRVFGRGPGIRATFALGKMERGSLLKLIAGYPELDRMQDLKTSVGSEAEVSGTLVGCDAFDDAIFLQVEPLPIEEEGPQIDESLQPA